MYAQQNRITTGFHFATVAVQLKGNQYSQIRAMIDGT